MKFLFQDETHGSLPVEELEKMAFNRNSNDFINLEKQTAHIEPDNRVNV